MRPREPISKGNYVQRALEHCLAQVDRGGIHPTISQGMPEWDEWLVYFDQHLGYRPVALRRVMAGDGKNADYTVPELHPEWFDSDYQPRSR